MKKITFIILLFGIAMNGFTESQLVNALKSQKDNFALVLPKKYQRGKVYVFDISKQSDTFKDIDVTSSEALIDHSCQLRKKVNADMMVGKYLEDRNIYRGDQYKTSHNEVRSVHLGQDLMVPAGTAVFSPLAGTVHSFQDNDMDADYGPTIILEHRLNQITFYTLYGHLSRDSLTPLKVGQTIQKGQQIANIGQTFENGGWPTHLHFQIIDDMKGEKGNFVGVIEPSKISQFAVHCPDPNLILGIHALS